MNEPFISTYYKLFNKSNDNIFLLFDEIMLLNKIEFVKNINNVDYLIIYEERNFLKLKENKNIFKKLLKLKKIFLLLKYDKFCLNIINNYNNRISYGLRIDLSDKNFLSFFNIPNKVKNLFIDKYNLKLRFNITNYLPSSCITIDIDNATEYKITNLPNKLKILNIQRSLNLSNNIKLPKNTCLIFHSHLLSENNYYHHLFRYNKQNTIIIDYFDNDKEYLTNEKFYENLVIKRQEKISFNKIIYNTIKINDEYDDNLYICTKIKSFFMSSDNCRYVWKYFTNSFIDVISNEYYAFYPNEIEQTKEYDYDKNLSLISLIICKN